MEPSSTAEQRAFFVAKLKRAASLPRMKDGRRPPMHVEAVSEGERSLEEYGEGEERRGRSGSSVRISVVERQRDPEDDDDDDDEEEEHGGDEGAQLASHTVHVNGGETERVEKEPALEEALAQEVEVEEADDALVERREAISPPRTPLPSEDTSTAATTQGKRKRRSRSRRRSKDSKAKGRAGQPSPAFVSANDSSPDDEPMANYPASPSPVPLQPSPSPIPPFPNGFAATPLISPIPAHFLALQQQRMLMSPEPSMMYPGTSPPTPGPMLTLQDIQREAYSRGLFRSNSAAARLMAMNQLTRNEQPDPSLSSPSPGPKGLGLGRNNTVAGGERTAVRRLMMGRLKERLKEKQEEAEAEQTSAGEDQPTPPPPKRRSRRRSRRSSNRSTVVDDRELSSTTSPNTPINGPTPLPLEIPSNPPRPPSSLTRSPTPSGRRSSIERQREEALLKLMGSPVSPTYEKSPMEIRGVVVEEDDEQDRPLSPPRPPFSGAPLAASPRVSAIRGTHASESPSTYSTEAGEGVPVYLSSSPFATPLKEQPGLDEDDEDMLLDAGSGSGGKRWTDGYNRDISWAAEPVPEDPRIPIHDDDDYDDVEHEARSVPIEEREPYEEPPSPYTDSHDDEPSHEDVHVHVRDHDYGHDHDLDLEHAATSPEPTHSMVSPSPSSAAALQSEPVYPVRLSVASAINPELSSPHTDYLEWEEPARATGSGPETPKKNGEPSTSVSRWDKVKNLMRTNSSQGRRSRTNSIRERTTNTDSSVTRESGASHTSSSQTDKGDKNALDLSLPNFQNASNGPSPVPPASPEMIARYQDSKLFPFPGIQKLQEQRNRALGHAANASSPDIFLQTGEDVHGSGSNSSHTPQPSPEVPRERKLSHQASDSRLVSKFSGAPLIANVPSSASQQFYDPFIATSPAAGSANGNGNVSWLNGKLPHNREGVKKWLTAKKLFSSQGSTVSQSTMLQISAPILQPTTADKKPSLSDLFKGRKENGLMSDWEDVSKTPTSTSGSTLLGKGSVKDGRESAVTPETSVTTNGTSMSSAPSTSQPRDTVEDVSPSPVHSPNGDAQFTPYPGGVDPRHLMPSPPDLTSTTPDPMSSLDSFPIRSESSSSTLSSRRSAEPVMVQSQRSIVLERLDEILNRTTSSRGPSGASFIDDPPRKLLLSSPVLQVANSNTVKDRFLFLFNDILVIAKPVFQDPESLLDITRPSPLDRKFIVKNVVQLRHLRFSADRDDLACKSPASSPMNRHPLIRSFVVQFQKEPDHAISSLFEKTSMSAEPVLLGQLLMKTLDLDRAMLGVYLSRRTSKVVLKAYIDGFGFTGMRVDKALRVFLQSLHIPALSRSSHSTPLDYMVDSFASRWYEANKGNVAYDKDLAIRLVRALVQLNEAIHGGVVHELGSPGRLKRNILNRDFIDAFRRYDPRGLVPDELLDKMYSSIRREPLSQARNSATSTSPNLVITLKRPVPPRLTYKMQSEPVIIRIPQIDPNLVIQLYGQDLICDPPMLTFARSPEASFRVTGTSLGLRNLIFLRSGPSALAYTGVPLSCPIVIERSFMRNTFQVAFSDYMQQKRKYMFSVEDPVMRHNWSASLKRQIEVASTAFASASTTSAYSANSNSNSSSPSAFQQATDDAMFRILQDTLIASVEDTEWMARSLSRSPPASPTPFGHSRVTSSPSPLPMSSSGRPSPGPGYTSRSPGLTSSTFVQAQAQAQRPRGGNYTSSHVRSKSRSQVYHRRGLGSLEPPQSPSPVPTSGTTGAPDPERARDSERGESEGDGDMKMQEVPIENARSRLWSGKDLETVCLQNSSVGVALAALKVGLGAHVNGNGNGNENGGGLGSGASELQRQGSRRGQS